MGLSQSIKALISYDNIDDISKAYWNYNTEIDYMEKGRKEKEIIIDIKEIKYWKKRKKELEYRSNIVIKKRKEDIASLKHKLKNLS